MFAVLMAVDKHPKLLFFRAFLPSSSYRSVEQR